MILYGRAAEKQRPPAGSGDKSSMLSVLFGQGEVLVIVIITVIVVFILVRRRKR